MARSNSAPVAFVAGHPVAHSRSPLIHRTWLAEHGLAGDYRAIDVAVEDFTAFVAALKAGTDGFVGGNVTLPHKEAALVLADRRDPLAEEIGAANTLWLEDGEVHAANTDAYGFCANLDHGADGWDRDASSKIAVVLGAGGASRAVIQGLRDRGFGEIRLANRTEQRAQALADRFGSQVTAHPSAALDELLAGASLFVNTSSLGMGSDAVPDLDFLVMRDGALVTDIVYAPLQTPFLLKARAQGLATVDGLGMLLHQAVPGFERWFGVRPTVSAELRQRIVSDLEGAA